jgi:hypothetical protein
VGPLVAAAALTFMLGVGVGRASWDGGAPLGGSTDAGVAVVASSSSLLREGAGSPQGQLRQLPPKHEGGSSVDGMMTMQVGPSLSAVV